MEPDRRLEEFILMAYCKIKYLRRGILITVLICALWSIDNRAVFAQAGSIRVKGNTEANYLTFSGNRTGYPGNPSEGELFYNSSEKVVRYFDGAQWRAIGAGSATSKSIATKVVAASNTTGASNRADYVCTGANDQAIINSAISALGAKGGTIYLAEGTYNISGPINIGSSDVSLIGSGRATVLRVTAGSGNIKVINAVGPGIAGLQISGLLIDGNNRTGSGNIGVYFEYIEESRIKDLWIENLSGYGISLWWSNKNSVCSCRIYGCSSSGSIDLGEGSNYNVLTNNTIDAALAGGIKDSGVMGGGSNIICNNQILGESGTSRGVDLGHSYDIVCGNIIRQKLHGVNVSGGEYSIVSGNIINDSSQYGIQSNGNNNMFSGNILDANMFGASFYDYASSNIISSNLISNDYGSTIGSFGMRFDTGSHNLVTTNSIWGNNPAIGDTYGIRLQSAAGTMNYLAGNLIGGSRYEVKIRDDGGNSYTDKLKMTLDATQVNVSASTYTLDFKVVGGYIKLYSTAPSNVNLTLGRGFGMGNIIVLENVSPNNRTFTIGSGLGPVNVYGSTIILGYGDTASLIWNGTKWLGLTKSDNG